MKFSVAYLALFVAGTLAQFTINTPANVVECQPTLLQWSGGTAPYFLSILPGATPNGAAVENLGQQNSTSVTWVCNIQSGTSLGLTLRDSTGLTAQSAPFTVNPGSSTTCTNTTSLSSGPTVASSAAAPTGTTPATSGTGTTAHTTSATTAAGSASTSSSAASANVVRVGAAGIAGAAAVAALLF
ncbi:uncharacterized protein F5891DRAFT_1009550 [Suillus fuscotomentosus]|uniref:GPI anchored protein n=1 Tax=Suillus fuscotomentosus TaxID=1912939 RepID=A0AAD4EFY5_9AGAM|nr:uncharacterized protein F5891DRAFT_1009550 [Suillus fuscotomentosus]KAG1905483.1 hypothetical protein F5891DRAFT_1009550 [Suillus fuscotomentosus]